MTNKLHRVYFQWDLKTKADRPPTNPQRGSPDIQVILLASWMDYNTGQLFVKLGNLNVNQLFFILLLLYYLLSFFPQWLLDSHYSSTHVSKCHTFLCYFFHFIMWGRDRLNTSYIGQSSDGQRLAVKLGEILFTGSSVSHTSQGHSCYPCREPLSLLITEFLSPKPTLW